jgi:multisubunit Na+/H+ antiporter MnhG subunit
VSAGKVITDVLLGLADLIVLACSVGVLLMRNVYQRLHFVGPISMVATVLVGLAVTFTSAWHSNTGETWIAIGIVALSAPYVSHATIRAARIRDEGDWRVLDPDTQPAERSPHS